MPTTAAHFYGVFLGNMQRAIEDFAKQISEGFKLGYAPPDQITEEELDRIQEVKSQARYIRRINLERRLGREFVRKEARRVREELGLPKI